MNTLLGRALMGLAAAAALATALPAQAGGGDGPEISRSRGKKGGVVVLYPRIVPATQDATVTDLAGKLQQKLAALAGGVVDPKKVDVRPAPERVCNQLGCKAASVSIMVGQRNGGCALVGIVSGPGTSPQQLVPLAGQLQLMGSSAPFRQPPEQLLTISEFAACATVLETLDLSGVQSALQRLVPQE